MADRVERPLSLFDELEAFAPARAPVPDPREARDPARAPMHDEQEALAPAWAPVQDERDAEATDEMVPAEQAPTGVHGGVGGEPTLDDMLVAAWEGLTAQAVVACPVCDGAMQPLYGDAGGASPVTAGRCGHCGTTLS